MLGFFLALRARGAGEEVKGERREGRSPGTVGGFSFREAVCRIADDFPMTVAGGAYEADDAGGF